MAAAKAVALALPAAGAVAPGAGILRLRAQVSAASLWWWTRGANRGALCMVAEAARAPRAAASARSAAGPPAAAAGEGPAAARRGGNTANRRP